MYAEAGSRRSAGLPTVASLLPAAAAAAGVLGVVAAYSPKIAIAALLGGAFLGVALWRLEVGVAVFSVLTFPAHLPGAFGADATLAKPVGALILLAWLAIVVRRGSGSVALLPRDRPAFFWTLVAFLVLGGASALWAADAGQAAYELSRLVQVAVLLLVVYTAASTHSGFRTVIWGFLVASVITSVYAMVSGAYEDHGRLAGLFDPNYFAAELIPAIVLALFLFVSTDSARTRGLVAVVGCIDLAAFALTQSRGGIVGLSVALLAAIVFAGRRARPRVLVLVLVLVAGALGYYLGYRPTHVFESLSGGLSGASSGRSDEWRIALHMLGGHPLQGVGLGNFTVVEPSYATHTLNLEFSRFDVQYRLAAHSSYLEVAAELGVPGLLLFLGVLLTPLRLAGRAFRELERRLDPLEFHVRGLVAGAIGMFTSYIFLSAEWEKQLWLVLALLAAAAVLHREGDAQRKRNAR